MTELTVNKDRFGDFAGQLAAHIESKVGSDKITADTIKDAIKCAVDNHCKRKQDAHMDGMDLTMLAGEVICAVANKAGATPDVFLQAQKAVIEAIQDYCGANNNETANPQSK